MKINHGHITKRTRRIYTALGVLATIGIITIAAFQLLVFISYQDIEGDRNDTLSTLLQKTATPTTVSQKNSMAVEYVQPDTLQAVFLSNGQVYFGRITTLTPDLVILTDVFYPKAQTTDQETVAEDASAETITEAGGVALRKLGKNEFHEPQDTLYIEPKNMLYWENLEKKSRVTKGILEYETKQAPGSSVKTTPATTDDASAKNEASESTANTNSNVTSEEDPTDLEN